MSSEEVRHPGSESSTATIPTIEAVTCCTAKKQTTCCDSSEKSTCCGSAATAGGGCGCQ